MDLPTPDEIEDDPGGAIVRLRNLRSELDGAERAAITAAVRQGWSLTAIADRFGISRQAVTQRMQRALVTRRPKAAPAGRGYFRGKSGSPLTTGRPPG